MKELVPELSKADIAEGFFWAVDPEVCGHVARIDDAIRLERAIGFADPIMPNRSLESP
jgi:hypothetical protein